MRSSNLTVMIVGCALLAACGPTSHEEPMPSEPKVPAGAVAVRTEPFDAVLQQFRSYSGLEERERLVVRSDAEWRQLWARIAANVQPTPGAPAVDFSRQMVILAAMGERGTGGHVIAVDGVYESGGALYAAVRESSPGRGCMTTQAVTQPVTAVLVPKSDAPVRFVERQEVKECE